MSKHTDKINSKSLVEILGREQGYKVCDILSKAKSSAEAVEQLKVYYHSIEDHLEKQGLDPDYLAYATVAALNQFLGMISKAQNN